MTPSMFLASFADAASKPITKMVEWPDTIPTAHPIRQLYLCVRFWPPLVTAFINNEMTQPPVDKDKPEIAYNWYSTLYWYVIAASTCTIDGSPIFTESWPDIWKRHTEKLQLEWDEVRTRQINFERAERLPPSDPFPPRPTFATNDDGSVATPPPDYKIIGDWLKSQYDTLQGRMIMEPLWDTAMSYNGWKLSLSKNSETTDTSVPSTVKP